MMYFTLQYLFVRPLNYLNNYCISNYDVDTLTIHSTLQYLFVRPSDDGTSYHILVYVFIIFFVFEDKLEVILRSCQ